MLSGRQEINQEDSEYDSGDVGEECEQRNAQNKRNRFSLGDDFSLYVEQTIWTFYYDGSASLIAYMSRKVIVKLSCA